MAIRLDQPFHRLPASMGGVPEFEEGLKLVHPSIPDEERLLGAFQEILSSGMLTNGRFVEELERQAAEYLGVRHCVAVSSCTSGLMLLFRAAELTGDVIIPSFTFSATGHAVVWNGLRPIYADIDPETLTLSADAVRHLVGVRTSAIVATHIYGTPCDVEGLREVATENGIKLYFDAAHAFGSQHNGVCAGALGDAEVFSLSPTKVMVAGEGGIISTNDDVLAARLRMGRDYGNPGNYDCRFIGLNARMSEFHAAVALASLSDLDDRVDRRIHLVEVYRHVLSGIPGISFPTLPAGDRSTFKDFTIFVDPDRFGIDADRLKDALAAEGIESRRYYSPPLHRMEAYRSIRGSSGPLPATERAAETVLTLPLWTEMSESDIARVGQVIESIREAVAGAGPIGPMAEKTTAEGS